MNTHSLRFAFILVLAAGMFFAGAACRSIPPGVSGDGARALAAKMQAAVNYEAWQKKTAAVGWTFIGKNRHFWDRKRDLVEVQWDEYIARFNKNTLQGIVLEDGKPVQDSNRSQELLAEANAHFVNDAFWLNPLFHIDSPGVELSLVSENSLKVAFTSGGVTPGDTYVLHAGEDGLVKEMQLWVSILPFKGTSAAFENYATSETGVKSARKYDFLITIDITDVKMYAKYPEGGGEDRFADLLK